MDDHIGGMRLLEPHNCADYLREREWIAHDEDVVVRALAGGVSNVVLHVQRGAERGDDFVLKQAREQLRVEQPWFCGVERIWREVEVLRICNIVLQNETSVCVPEVLFEDRDNYTFAMTAAPPGHVTWKERLMAGHCEENIAVACGELLGQLHAGTWGAAHVAEQLDDREYFIDLRVDPYYRRVAEIHSELRESMENLIDSLGTNRSCLVHGDFSPKNLLLWNRPSPQVMLIDCEVGHYGDPAFDLGFFLSHLVLKAVYHSAQGANASADALRLCDRFWSAYGRLVGQAISPAEFDVLQQRAVKNLAGCLIARVDGKSPVEYLTVQAKQEFVRRLARRLFQSSQTELAEAFQFASDAIKEI